ncbi:Scm3p Ecym_8063 [Eremothecium cymbalariae DBVPG|uniref:Uncharacterized protein n=1 Tax=Eremothecium cymbalariae (strain CBS 270.75 / DBVPG 7215 / KCTC 17166 / NRRL Y-17582) TaxID=931890 RepID=G8JWY5_ERECY|nr:Hypothetical protein Ecym_8063 [Eremothecium cymbalariae DBVPG\
MISKKPKTARLRLLTGALKELLQNEGQVGAKKEEAIGESTPVMEKNGIVYIMSKENQLIPKLSDEEVMERHRRADENMKQAWADIIEKYESVEDQGDVVDLQTGEIVEDNGHIRSIQSFGSVRDTKDVAADVKYKSVLTDILDIEDDGRNVWLSGEEEDKDDSYATNTSDDGATSDQDGSGNQ